MANRLGKTKRDTATVTGHPLFPAIVALWFAALFGLGSLAIRPALIEGLVLQSQLDTVLPAAAPPLGLTARILIALAMAAVGGVLGALLGKRIGQPSVEPGVRKRAAMGSAPKHDEWEVRARDAHADAPARRPILAHEEIGEGISPSETPNGTLPGRRRALTAEEPSGSFDVPLLAPLPGSASEVIDHSQSMPFEPAVHAPFEPAVGRDDSFAPLDLEAFAEPASDPIPTEIEANQPHQVFGEPAASMPMTEADTVPSILSEASKSTSPDSLDLLALTERFANALRERRERVAAATQATAQSEGENAPLVLPRFASVAQEPDEDRPVAALAMPAAMRPLVPDDESMEDDDYSSFLPLRRIPMEKPETEQVKSPSSDESTSAMAEFTLLPSHLAPFESEVDEAGSNYPSLLDISSSSPPRQLFARIEEPATDPAAIDPVVVFPGQSSHYSATLPATSVESPTAMQRFDAPGNAVAGQSVAAMHSAIAPEDSAETERALRAALASLQRISGAA
jgi:hypothetical protein